MSRLLGMNTVSQSSYVSSFRFRYHSSQQQIDHIDQKISIKEDDPRVEQPKGIKIPLKQHQLACIWRMYELDQKYKLEVEKDQTKWAVFSKYGVLGDVVGYGKTMSMLGLISLCKENPLEFKKPITNTQFACDSRSASSFFLIENTKDRCPIHIEKTDDVIDTTLIIVPNKLMKQWEGEIKKTNLTYKTINVGIRKKKSGQMPVELDRSIAERHDIILCAATKVRSVLGTVLGTPSAFTWNRIVMDEADTISSGSLCEKARFIWFMTATWKRLTTKQYRKEPHASLLENGKDSWSNPNQMIHCLTVRCDEAFLRKSFSMPPITEKSIRCKSSVVVAIIRDDVPEEALEFLCAGDLSGAIVKLGGCRETDKNILDVVKSRYNKLIEKYELDIEHHTHNPLLSAPQKKNLIKKCNGKIESINTKIEVLEEKIKNMKEEECGICLTEMDNPALTPCCNNVYCAECLITWLTQQRNTCPQCRETMKSEDIMYLCEDEEDRIEKRNQSDTDKSAEEFQSKQEAVLELIKSKPNAKIIIFSNHNASFHLISNYLRKENVTYRNLYGTVKKVERVLNEFREGKFSVLMLNARISGTGLNVECATDIVLYHRLEDYDKQQVIGRAMRLGRKDPLTVTQLYFPEEE